MAKRQWEIQVEGVPHVVEYKQSSWTGKREILVDGNKVLEGRPNFLDPSADMPFKIGNTDCRLKIKAGLLLPDYDLIVGGRSLKTGQPVAPYQPASPMPVWGWLFVVACIAIPIVALGGLIPVVIGLVGAGGCYRLARSSSMDTSTRLLACIGVTVVCWIAFGALALGIASLSRR